MGISGFDNPSPINTFSGTVLPTDHPRISHITTGVFETPEITAFRQQGHGRECVDSFQAFQITDRSSIVHTLGQRFYFAIQISQVRVDLFQYSKIRLVGFSEIFQIKLLLPQPFPVSLGPIFLTLINPALSKQEFH